MTALDALYAKADAFDGMRTRAWATWSDHFVKSTRGEVPDGTATSRDPVDETGHAMTARLVRDLDTAETFYVSPDMSRLVIAAAAEWEPDEPVFMEDWPSAVGWMWVPGGLTHIDIRGSFVTTDAVSWHVTGGRVILTYWADKRHDPEHVRTDAWDLMPRLTPWHVMYQDLGKPLVRSVQMGHLLPPEMSQAIHWTTTPNGSLTAFVPDGMTKDEMTPRVLPDQVLTWLVSALRIMVTPLADVHRQGLPANVRKALARRPHRFKQKAVTVIEFRRRDVSAEQTTHRDFSHRFLRRGHWRKQWMGSDLHGDRRQVRIWIHPTICGPADKPLILRSHVNAFTR